MANFKYKRIEQWVRDEIEAGRFRPGDRIPTEPELMAQFDVSRKTIRLAVDHLSGEGILHRIQGSGTYISDRAEDDAANSPDMLWRGSAGSLSPDGTGSAGGQIFSFGTVALIMMDSNNYIFPDIMRGASEVLARNGYSMSVYFTDNDYETEYHVIQKLLNQPPDGIIFEPVMLGSLFLNHESYRALADQIPTLMIHHDQPDIFPALPLLDRSGGRRLTDYLLDLGHENIGTIFFMNENTAYGRYLGFIDALRARGLKQSHSLSIWTERQKIDDLFEPSGNLPLERLLNNATAVICHDDRVAYSLITHLQRRGIRVPEDLSVVGYDNSFFSTLNVPITTVTHPREDYGRNAGLALLSLMRGETADFGRLAVEPELIVRASAQAPGRLLGTQVNTDELSGR